MVTYDVQKCSYYEINWTKQNMDEKKFIAIAFIPIKYEHNINTGKNWDKINKSNPYEVEKNITQDAFWHVSIQSFEKPLTFFVKKIV